MNEALGKKPPVEFDGTYEVFTNLEEHYRTALLELADLEEKDCYFVQFLDSVQTCVQKKWKMGKCCYQCKKAKQARKSAGEVKP